MKKIIPLILFFAFVLNSCDKEPQPEPINNTLDFSELLSFMEQEYDQIEKNIPGTLHETYNSAKHKVWIYLMFPENINMKDSLFISYVFNNDSLDQIHFRPTYAENNLDLTKKMINLAVEQLGEGEYGLASRGLGNLFSTANEMWEFIETNDIKPREIVELISQWGSKNQKLYIGFTYLHGPFNANIY